MSDDASLSDVAYGISLMCLWIIVIRLQFQVWALERDK